MDYIFGTNGDNEILKTKGTEHSGLMGFHEVKREYPDQTITDRFRIVEKIRSAQDEEGNCYDWYTITDHYRTTDRTPRLIPRIDGNETAIAATEDALCEMYQTTSTSVSELEDALCELYDMIASNEE